MSDITATQWSVATVQALRAFESTCDDEDLFCVGYLIPQVELVEMVYANHEGSSAEWHEVYVQYVEQSMTDDTMQGTDVERIREILTTLMN